MKRICLVLAALVLAGCQTQQAVTPPPSVAPSPVVPSQTMPPAPPVESAGPLTKAGVETYMDAQETDLRSYLRGQGVLVARRGDTLAITVPSDKLFEKGAVSAWGDALLQSVAQVLAHYDHTLIDVNGYTNAHGDEQQSLSASEKRARAVLDGLVRYGVASSRMKAFGLGATNLRVADANDPRNRRIEIKITPDPK
jgi:outer membrane protein OmpA-like peptidoglycan-associated protein